MRSSCPCAVALNLIALLLAPVARAETPNDTPSPTPAPPSTASVDDTWYSGPSQLDRIDDVVALNVTALTERQAALNKAVADLTAAKAKTKDAAKSTKADEQIALVNVQLDRVSKLLSEASRRQQRIQRLRNQFRDSYAGQDYGFRRQAGFSLSALAKDNEAASQDVGNLLKTQVPTELAPANDTAGASQADAAKATATAAKIVRDTPPPGPAPPAEAAQPKSTAPVPGDVTLEQGGDIHYGLTVSLLRFSTTRRSNEPARLRNYTPSLELLPPEFGFQFVYRPMGRPWRLNRAGDGSFQLLSAGGILLAHVDNQDFSRGGLSIAATLGLFDEAVGIGAGVDLYRGIPVRSADGKDGGATAYTGLLSWGFAREGEVTPENVFIVVTLNLNGLASKVAGNGK